MIEVDAQREFRESLRIAMPSLSGNEKSTSVVRVEYEWKPPRCSGCKVFGHKDVECPRNIPVVTENLKHGDDRFHIVGKKQGKSKVGDQNAKMGGGNKQKSKLVYRPVIKTNSQNVENRKNMKMDASGPSNNKNVVQIDNAYAALNNLNEDELFHGPKSGNINAEDNDSDVEEQVDETTEFMAAKTSEGASTHGKRVSHGYLCKAGTRIILGWNPDVVNVMVLAMSDQVVHCQVHSVVGDLKLYVSFIYAHNYYIHRRSLWNELGAHQVFVANNPWVIMGDFNASLTLDDSSNGPSSMSIAMREFKECVDHLCMTDVNHMGLQFTWNQRSHSLTGVLKKIDRIMANAEFFHEYANAYAVFHPYRISDHSPTVLKFPSLQRSRPKPFKFSNFVTSHDDFHETVEWGCSVEVQGVRMFQVVKKLRSLKKPLRKLSWSKGNLHERVVKLRNDLDLAQINLDRDHSSITLREVESNTLKDFNEAVLIEEKFLKQKAKIEWLRARDNNSSYFYNVVKAKTHRSRIQVIEDDMGQFVEGAAVPNIFVNHFNSFIGTTCPTDPILSPDDLFVTKIDEAKALLMVREVDAAEIKRAVFDLGLDKSPGPDGFTTEFFRAAWDIVGDDVTATVKQFFLNRKLLSEINHTILSLLLKVKTPTKVDIQKAYDTVDWDFLEFILYKLGFHEQIISWIMSCVRSSSFSICINGELHGYFKGKCGLRQGDPMSPYLFTLVMEVLSLMLNRRIVELSSFRFHPKCEKLKIINLCFADEFFLFSFANTDSVQVITSALDEFKRCSGLVPSLPKSKAFFANVPQGVKSAILNILPFEEGKLPVKYLGVPLVSSSLFHRYCKVLSVFMLPSSIIKEIEAFMRGFLWCQGDMKKGKAKVKWFRVYLPKEEGGLGIKRIKEWNLALLTSLIWRMLTCKQSLWVRWVHMYHLKGDNFWNFTAIAGVSVGWRKLMSIRDIVRSHFVTRIGDGSQCLAWYDTWCDYGPLANFISNRHIVRAGFARESKIRDICWENIAVPILNDSPDATKWLGIIVFSVSKVWSTIRSRSNEVPWFNVVWFAHCIPRHSFIVWLLMGENLKTQDKLNAWDTRVNGNTPMVCPLCSLQPDSHEHLFFECPFSTRVWLLATKNMMFLFTGNSWKTFVEFANGFAAKRSAASITAKLLFGATVYFVWQERNCRLFKKETRSCDKLVAVIFHMVRLKLISIKWKQTRQTRLMKDAWKIP
ncbi:uncharacterized protein [Rutidosis leptorrhynchoides]|uniref:uncharacterized protein n=1 Tax=Rutidosis leptorrhynchoides TaxID=125765 RepID=UPI003A998F77